MNIYKYDIGDAFFESVVTVKAPGVMSICHAGLDPSGRVCVWAITEEGESPDAKIQVSIYGTGHDIEYDPPMVHLNSYVTGPFVWHVFGTINYGA